MENPSPPPSSNKTAKAKMVELTKTLFGSMNEDLLQKILKRLPAASFASAACVNKLWNRVSNRILSRPKLASAFSYDALEEAVDKVLSEPIRPHFAIANVFGTRFGLDHSLTSLAKKLGSKIPILVTRAPGIMGRHAITDEFKEVLGGESFKNSGIVLTVGFVPGLKVKAIPLLHSEVGNFKASEDAMVDNFVMEIRKFSASVSGCTSPVAIIMFGKIYGDQKSVIKKLDYAMSMETIIVGDERAGFCYRTGMEQSYYVCGNLDGLSHTIALVFARDRYKPHDIGEIQFHAAMSSGISAIGPRYKAVSVRTNSNELVTWLTARIDGQQEILDGNSMLNDIENQMRETIEYYDLFIGVTKRRKCFIGSEKSRSMRFLEFHAVTEGNEEYLYVDGGGIRTGDYFQFYYSDPSTASSSCSNVSLNLRNLKLNWSSENRIHPSPFGNKVDKRECFGGFIFTCCGRGESFFNKFSVNSAPFVENFPEVPLAGIFCTGEIGRGISFLNANESHQEESKGHHCLHVYSSVYLLISYTPALQSINSRPCSSSR